MGVTWQKWNTGNKLPSPNLNTGHSQRMQPNFQAVGRLVLVGRDIKPTGNSYSAADGRADIPQKEHGSRRKTTGFANSIKRVRK